MREIIDNFIKEVPQAAFPMFLAGIDKLSDNIYKEFLNWQKGNPEIQSLKFNEIKDKNDERYTILYWEIEKNKGLAQRIDFTMSPFSIEHYEIVMEQIYSFAKAKPQYYKFIDFQHPQDGMNPLELLLTKLLY